MTKIIEFTQFPDHRIDICEGIPDNAYDITIKAIYSDGFPGKVSHMKWGKPSLNRFYQSMKTKSFNINNIQKLIIEYKTSGIGSLKVSKSATNFSRLVYVSNTMNNELQKIGLRPGRPGDILKLRTTKGVELTFNFECSQRAYCICGVKGNVRKVQ